jgi:sirohydrochlorin ferrochelatase
VIVAHGSPSDPEPAERWIRSLAERVDGMLPGITVRGATLAAAGAFERAIAGAAPLEPLIYPMFMADGWFVRQAIPDRLAAIGAGRCRIASPFGRDQRVWALCREAAIQAAARKGWRPADTTLVLAAHGSPSDPRPRDAAERAADFLRGAGVFRSVSCGFVDESPTIAEAARVIDPAICLPFFANRARHVMVDLPEMLAAARFSGVTLDPIGLHPRAAGVIARAVSPDIVTGGRHRPPALLDHGQGVANR